MRRARRQPPDIPAILRLLADYRIRYVLIGSVAVQAWGVDVGVPGDLDIVPEHSRENLTRMAAALKVMDAESWPVTGRWVTDKRGERRWENLSSDDPAYMSRLPAPHPSDISTFDSLYDTRFGNFDIVPILTGPYDQLFPDSHSLTVHGVGGVRVIGVNALLARLTVPRREKDASRVMALREIQRRTMT